MKKEYVIKGQNVYVIYTSNGRVITELFCIAESVSKAQEIAGCFNFGTK